MSTVLSLSERDAGYLAGIIDGEGHIDITKAGPTYNLRIVIKTTSKELAEWLVKTTGVGAKVKELHDSRKGPKDPKRLPNWMWRVFTNQAAQLLRQVQLVVKQQQAACAIKFQELSPKAKKDEGKDYRNRLRGLHLPAQNETHFENQSRPGVQEPGPPPKIETD